MPDKRKERPPAGKPGCDEKVDEALEESFPASDPPSYSPGQPGVPAEDTDKRGKDSERPEKRDAARSSGSGDRERERIDKGPTGDKVKAQDPAAAPLGTDDEAGKPGPTR